MARQGTLPPGPKNEKWVCWGAVGPKMAKAPKPKLEIF